MTIAHAIERGWLSTGGTGAQNYDEFADDAEITEIIAANPYSALAVEMPHRAPQSVGSSFAAALPQAVERLADAKAGGRYRPSADIVAAYRISGPDGAVGYGLWAMVDTDQISASVDEPGLVIRNEDVFPEKVAQRVALVQATDHLLSPVLLLQSAQGEMLQAALARAAAAEPAAVRDVDQAGRVHEVWPVGPGPEQAELLALAGGAELIVADGNHRSLAAQNAELPRFLAVITTAQSVTIQPYNRLVSQPPMAVEELVAELATAGAVVRPAPALSTAIPRGTIIVYGDRRAHAVELPADPSRDDVENLDHALVERLVFGRALGMDAGDKRITYVGGDYPVTWLAEEVDQGRADIAIAIPAVSVEDFIEVNLSRHKLPRKSTWFTPKARAGLVLVELAGAWRSS